MGGSRRVKKKNIKLLGNKPLICWTIEAAKKAKTLDYFLVSTDDEEIRKISKAHGARVPFKRPADISEDIDSVFALKHAVKWFEKKKGLHVGWVCCLQPTSPLRKAEDVDSCVRIAQATNADTVISIVKVSQHPYWCYEMKPVSQELVPFIDINLQGDMLVSQNLPLVFYPNGAVYVTKRDLIMQDRIFGSKICGYIMPHIRSIDLEEEFDFYVCSTALSVLQREEPVPQISW